MTRNTANLVSSRTADAEENWQAFEAIVYSKALKRMIKIVIVQNYNKDKTIKNCKIFATTDTAMMGIDLWLYYHLRFQIEFLYRDAKQFLGLTHCQSRQKERLNFQFNFALTLISLVKIVHWIVQPIDQRKPFSVQDIKTQYFNEHLLERFISAFGICPQTAKNNPKYSDLANYAKIAA